MSRKRKAKRMVWTRKELRRMRERKHFYASLDRRFKTAGAKPGAFNPFYGLRVGT